MMDESSFPVLSVLIIQENSSSPELFNEYPANAKLPSDICIIFSGTS